MCACMCVCTHVDPKAPLNKTRGRKKQMAPVLLVTALRVIDGICPAKNYWLCICLHKQYFESRWQ